VRAGQLKSRKMSAAINYFLSAFPEKLSKSVRNFHRKLGGIERAPRCLKVWQAAHEHGHGTRKPHRYSGGGLYHGDPDFGKTSDSRAISNITVQFSINTQGKFEGGAVINSSKSRPWRLQAQTVRRSPNKLSNLMPRSEPRGTQRRTWSWSSSRVGTDLW